MDVAIIISIVLIITFGIQALFVLAVYLRVEGKITPKGERLMVIGICLIPYIVSSFMDGFLVFWAAYTAMLLISLAIVGIIVGIRKLFNK